MSVCPLPSGPEPEDSSKTGSGPPEAETQLCQDWGRGEDEGIGLDARDSAVRRELSPRFASSPSSSLPQIFWEQTAHIFLFVHPQLPGMRGLSIPQPRTAERGPATSLAAGGSGLCWELGALWLLGSSWSWGAWEAWGSPGSSSDPGGMLPRGFLRFPHSDCFLSRPPSRKGQEVIEGRKLVGLSHGELAWCTGGSATVWVPRLCQVTLQRGADLGGRESRVATLPFRSQGIPHRSLRAVWKRSTM